MNDATAGCGDHSPIAAVSTPPGCGGIAVIRLSGEGALDVASRCWKGKRLDGVDSHTAHLGEITDSDGGMLDQVVATVYRAPRSYTGEDTVEFTCHGSPWIQQAIVSRLTECGARGAGPGEFTRRAYMNGRLDLAQAEGVADMIAASSRAAARLAATQMKGEFSRTLDALRGKLIEIAALLELELDFSEEDVEFADRQSLEGLTSDVLDTTARLAASYKAGAAFRHGIPVAIAGVPNAGKSSLLNRLLRDDKAIVSDIPGTTRDAIEDTAEIDGLLFRFIDTAGLRESDDAIETMGIERARRKISDAAIVVWLIDPTIPADDQLTQPEPLEAARRGARLIPVVGKCDAADTAETELAILRQLEAVGIADKEMEILTISSRSGAGLDRLERALAEAATADYNPAAELIVTNARHYASLLSASESLSRVKEGLQTGLSADFLAQDLREAVHHIGTITGAITTDDLLGTIFERFCIGK